MTDKKTHSFIDLFSGCGGMSLGFERAGFTSLLAIDNWQDALTTYAYNRRNAHTLCADISEVSTDEVKRIIGNTAVDVIIGGPPCQGFSVAGKRNVKDVRNSLYKSFVNFVAAFKPKAFVMENVPQILTMGNCSIRDAILSDFMKLGYQITYKILTASDYGVPQNRRRAVFVGLRNTVFAFPDATTETPVTSWQALSDLPEASINDGAPYPCEPLSDFQKAIRQNSNGVYNHDVTIHTAKTQQIIAMVPDGGNYKDLPEELWSTRKVHIAWTRLNSKKPSFTIDCGHNHHFHYSFNRVPTVRESARLQSFPDEFVFLGNKGSQLRQVGNAVPPLMAETIAKSLIPYINV
ncbi:MAG: DNA cytosine methyltransferase [Bacteroidales bacterium]|nr:DNA cytosine methyltransferase [Bacteroidales bacterium]